jgi:hypothetical protein
MAPKSKGKKGKGKKGGSSEPLHDPGWNRAVADGRWDRPVEALPDASQWPTWGALRERILSSAVKVSITHTQSLRDAFSAEVVKLSPPKLRQLELRGSNNLKQFVCSPSSSCPSLKSVDLSDCDGLNFTLIQSASLENLNLARCPCLVKALVQCRNLSTLRLDGCDALHTLILWSDSLTELDLSSCTKLSKLELYCPKLCEDNLRTPHIDSVSMAVDTRYLPISELLVENLNAMKQSEVTCADSQRREPVGSEPAISFVHARV